MIPIRRYLFPVRSIELPQRYTDVLVIGSGVAGTRAAIAAAHNGARVLVATKSSPLESNTRYAQGGIACALTDESPETGTIMEHVDDTRLAGGGICDIPVVDAIVSDAPRAIRELIEWGANFDRNAEGNLAFTFEGGHSKPRVMHARGDQTGIEIAETLVRKAQETPGIILLPDTFVIDLITIDGQCRGAICQERGRGPIIIWAGAVILAAGGSGRMYRETTNPAVATSDGPAMAFRAGAAIRDLEFMQFHPTTLYIAGAARALITEAVRGEGAHLLDRNGVRFMSDIHPSGELAPRDVVSRAIVNRMRETQDVCVYLDMSPIKNVQIRERFPAISALCDSFGIDVTSDPIPVRPSAHYHIGGVAADIEGNTTIPGLFVAGEASCTQFHGANRLGSNSLLEGLVTGRKSGAVAALHARNADYPPPNALDDDSKADRPWVEIDLVDLERSLRSLCTRNAGIEREAEGLENAMRQIESWASYVLPRTFSGPKGWTLQNLMTTSWLLCRQALARTESRGVHYRTDYPDVSGDWDHHGEFHWNPKTGVLE